MLSLSLASYCITLMASQSTYIFSILNRRTQQHLYAINDRKTLQQLVEVILTTSVLEGSSPT
jgi:hypothetical protein